jgi:hypothetical protein
MLSKKSQDLLRLLRSESGPTQTNRSLLAMSAHWGEPAVLLKRSHGEF